MYSAGIAEMNHGIIKGCSIVYGIPLRSSGQNIYFASPIGQERGLARVLFRSINDAGCAKKCTLKK
jgi:hypothetical protein